MSQTWKARRWGANVNTGFFEGYIGIKTEVKMNKAGKPQCFLTVIQDDHKLEDGKFVKCGSTAIDVVCYGRLATFVAGALEVGDGVHINYRLDQWGHGKFSKMKCRALSISVFEASSSVKARQEAARSESPTVPLEDLLDDEGVDDGEQ